jgi:ketosteroid isomerase-like protein
VIRDLTLELYEAMSSGDAAAVESFYSLAPDALYIGTAKGEFWTDPVRHNEDVRPYFDGSNGRMSVSAGTVHVVVDGDAAWVVDTPTMRLSDGTEFHVRLTLIWRREAGAWRVAHTHTSVGQ